MDIPTIRDTITPVLSGKLSVEINAYENAISSMEYKVYSLDGTEDVYKRQQTDGTVCFMGKDTSKLYGDELADIRREQIGFVFQDFYLMDSLSICLLYTSRCV